MNEIAWTRSKFIVFTRAGCVTFCDNCARSPCSHNLLRIVTRVTLHDETVVLKFPTGHGRNYHSTETCTSDSVPYVLLFHFQFE
jgi:hypothetical protein